MIFFSVSLIIFAVWLSIDTTTPKGTGLFMLLVAGSMVLGLIELAMS